jgi:hypothetical protein
MSLPGSDLALREIESKSNPGFDFTHAMTGADIAYLCQRAGNRIVCDLVSPA